MKRFKKEIINTLKQNKIPSSYNRFEEIIYSHLQNEYGTILCIFSCDKNIISSNCTYVKYIPANIIDHLQEYLDYFNNYMENGYLYIDANTNCVAFSIDYKIPDSKLNDEDLSSLRTFCTRFSNVFAQYQKEIYNIITFNHDSIKPVGSC